MSYFTFLLMFRVAGTRDDGLGSCWTSYCEVCGKNTARVLGACAYQSVVFVSKGAAPMPLGSAPMAMQMQLPMATPISVLVSPTGMQSGMPSGQAPTMGMPSTTLVSASAPSVVSVDDIKTRFQAFVKGKELNTVVADKLFKALSGCEVVLVLDDSDSMAQPIAEEGTDRELPFACCLCLYSRFTHLLIECYFFSVCAQTFDALARAQETSS